MLEKLCRKYNNIIFIFKYYAYYQQLPSIFFQVSIVSFSTTKLKSIKENLNIKFISTNPGMGQIFYIFILNFNFLNIHVYK